MTTDSQLSELYFNKESKLVDIKDHIEQAAKNQAVCFTKMDEQWFKAKIETNKPLDGVEPTVGDILKVVVTSSAGFLLEEVKKGEQLEVASQIAKRFEEQDRKISDLTASVSENIKHRTENIKCPPFRGETLGSSTENSSGSEFFLSNRRCVSK